MLVYDLTYHKLALWISNHNSALWIKGKSPPKIYKETLSGRALISLCPPVNINPKPSLNNQQWIFKNYHSQPRAEVIFLLKKVRSVIAQRDIVP